MARKMNGTAARSSMPSLVTSVNGVNHIFETNEEKANLLAQAYADVSSDAKYEGSFRDHKAIMEEAWSSEPSPPPGNETAAALEDPIGAGTSLALRSSAAKTTPRQVRTPSHTR